VRSPGTRFGPYEILSLLGAGGMGEVYRARDTRLGREVAIKVLPDSFAADPDRAARFEREARAASALSDPHIVAVYDVGHDGDTHYFVSELVDGSDLRSRMDSGPMPVRKALELAEQIASGLAAAHEKGIVHRDLKPENVLIAASGLAKIADFGLAKLTEPTDARFSQLPTSDGHQTSSGLVLGTVGYMSPEQAQARRVDYRSDQFAFGSILYEMLSGSTPFKRASPPETLAAIIREDPPPLSSVAPEVPAPVSWIVERCLAKDPADRFSATRDLARDLASLHQHLAGSSSSNFRAAAERPRAITLRRIAAASTVVAAALAAGFFLGRRERGGAGSSPPLTRFALEPPAGYTFSDFTSRGGPALSPDGGSIVFVAGDAAESTLWVQRLDGVGARELAGTGDAGFPFWSPDGTQVGFFADGKLRRIVLATGAVHVVCDAAFSLGATWTEHGTILFTPGPGHSILGVPARGGTPKPVIRLAAGEFMQVWPEALPGGERFLYESVTYDPRDPLGPRSNKLHAATLAGDPLPVADLEGASRAQFVPPDLLVYVSRNALVARRFDPDSLRFEGEPAVIAEPLVRLLVRGDSPFAASSRVLVYETGIEHNALIWYDRRGRRLGTVAEPGTRWAFDLSHDDASVLYARLDRDRGSLRIWRADTRRGEAEPITQGPAWNWSPIFAPDDRSMVFLSLRRGQPELFEQDLAPGSNAMLLPHFEGLDFPIDWTPDGSRILLLHRRPPAPWGIWQIDPKGGSPPRQLATDLGQTSGSRISPQGDLLAVAAGVSGRNEVYVEGYPDGGDRIRVSANGGVQPTWRRDGAELYFLGLDSYLYAASISRDPKLRAGPPERLFPLPLQGPLSLYQHYAPARDGQRFLVNALAEGRGAPARVVMGWRSLLGSR
jgi:Tol biopolymer transport system component